MSNWLRADLCRCIAGLYDLVGGSLVVADLFALFPAQDQKAMIPTTHVQKVEMIQLSLTRPQSQ